MNKQNKKISKTMKSDKLRHLWNVLNERLNSLKLERDRLENEICFTDNVLNFIDKLDKE